MKRWKVEADTKFTFLSALCTVGDLSCGLETSHVKAKRRRSARWCCPPTFHPLNPRQGRQQNTLQAVAPELAKCFFALSAQCEAAAIQPFHGVGDLAVEPMLHWSIAWELGQCPQVLARLWPARREHKAAECPCESQELGQDLGSPSPPSSGLAPSPSLPQCNTHRCPGEGVSQPFLN